MDTSYIISKMNDFMFRLGQQIGTWLSPKLPRITEDWWQELVLNNLTPLQLEAVIRKNIQEITGLDLASLLRVVNRNWFLLSSTHFMNPRERENVRFMQGIRNFWAHITPDDINKTRVIDDTNVIIALMQTFGAAMKDTRDMEQFIFDVEEVEGESYLKKVGAYVLVQPTKDGKGIMPYDYPWSSAPLYFRGEKVVPVWCVDRHGVVQEAVRIGDMTCRERKKQFRTDVPLPDNWLTCNGIILPANYVDIDRFEQIYRTHNAFRAFLSRSSDSEIIRQTAMVKGVSLPDHEMREACRRVCREIFGVRDVRVLDSTKRLELARKLRRRYLVSSKQLSRIVHVPVDEIERLL